MPKSKFVIELPREATKKQCHDFSKQAEEKSKDQNKLKVNRIWEVSYID